METENFLDYKGLALFKQLMEENFDVKLENNIKVVNAETHYDFPSIGKVDTIYKANSEKMIYQWNPIDLKYEKLNSGEMVDVELINGGNANG